MTRNLEMQRITSTNKSPITIPHHEFIVSSLIATFKMFYLRVKALSLLIGIVTHVHFEVMKVDIKDMYFERYPVAYFSVIFNQCLNQFNIVLSFMISKKAFNCLNKTGKYLIFLCSEKLVKFLTLNNFLDLRSNENTSFNFCFGKIWEQILYICLNAADSFTI